MIYLTKVERKGKNVQLTFSDSTILKIRQDVFKKFNLSEGISLTEELLKKLIEENNLYEAKISALRFLSIRNHSTKELQQKLLKKKIPSEIIDRVLNDLKDYQYVDDEKFAKQFYNELVGKFYGPLKIKNEFIKRGINRNLIDEILKQYVNDENLQKDVILRYLDKNKFPKKCRTKQELQKIYNHLLSRGFLSEIITNALREKYKFFSDE
ncbi:MAG: regulatory protein RecX [Ignavibacteria bacterium]|nr:regulatory protein RecX [Ignavibacteria bacterium]